MLNGGLTPLRYTRASSSNHQGLALVAAGQAAGFKSGSSGLFKAFPPKVG
jgi:hypothetical protein